jgi:uncharacterized protein YbjT (DUF2867 family)
MYIILGGTGHVGSQLTRSLLERRLPVTIVSRNRAKASTCEALGAKVAVADINDVGRLRDIFSRGTRLFLLNPPAAPDTDTDRTERRSVASILEALDELSPERVVAHSTYGAQPGEAVGDLSVLHELEQGLKEKPYPVYITRAAYYFSNWDMALDEARERGAITSFFPDDFVLPMVAPADLGAVAAAFISTDDYEAGVHYVEGPRRYSPRHIADAIGRLLDKRIEVAVVPERDWVQTFRKFGFSDAAAHSYARMTAVTLRNPQLPNHPMRGTTSFDNYVRSMVSA